MENLFERIENMLTIDQLCEKYGYSESSVRSNFRRTAAAFQKKYGKKLTKVKGFKDCYIIEEKEYSLYKEMKELFNEDFLINNNFKFFVIEGILTSPFGAFRGTQEEFLNQIGVKNTEDNILKLTQVLKELALKEYINYSQDEVSFVVFPKKNGISQINVENIVNYCKDIVRQNHNNKDKLFQCIKGWIIMDYCFYGANFSYENISYLTGLTKNQINNVKDLLLTNDKFQSSAVGLHLRNKKGKI